MNSTNTRRWAGAVRRSVWLGSVVAVAVALGPAAARGDVESAAALQPEQIRMVQRALKEHGLDVAPTGAWDEPTRVALGAFQASSGLPRTGQLDPATSRALGVDPYTAMPVGGKDVSPAPPRRDPAVNCDINNTIDCRPGGG